MHVMSLVHLCLYCPPYSSFVSMRTLSTDACHFLLFSLLFTPIFTLCEAFIPRTHSSQSVCPSTPSLSHQNTRCLQEGLRCAGSGVLAPMDKRVLCCFWDTICTLRCERINIADYMNCYTIKITLKYVSVECGRTRAGRC